MHQVTIFTTPTCVYCTRAKEFFKKNNIAYQERDVAADQKARQDMITRSGQMGVPVIDVDGKLTIGFDQTRLKEALNIKV